MNPKHIFVSLLIIVSLATAGYWLLSPRKQVVHTFFVDSAPATRVLAVNGRVRPKLQIDRRPTASGELIALPFDVGDLVTAGQVLARIDDAPEAAAVAQAEASAGAQEATLARVRRDLNRSEALGEFAPKRDVEQLRLSVAENERELERRQASVVQARELRERRVLRAPFPGVILERPVDPGQTVGVESIIYRLADLSDPEITVEVDEIYATEIRAGTEALVNFPGQQQPIEATVVHIEPRVDPATGARDVRLSLKDALEINAPSGLTVTVNLIIERRGAALSVPRRAIVQSDQPAQVRIVSDHGIVSNRQVTFIDWPSERVIVTEGLKPGERILIDPDAAEPGDQVEARAADK